MLRVVAVIVVVASGCYSDPDYGATAFKCDAVHSCPAGQTCVNGSCAGGEGAAHTVACGPARCGADQKCCFDFTAGASCVALDTSCLGFAATCDGVADCGGNACCSVGLSIACGGATCANQICLDARDCTSATAPACCFGMGPVGEPWGTCRASCGV